MIAHLGNASPIHGAAVEGGSTTAVNFPAGLTVAEALADVTDGSGVWVNQSADAAPLWVAADDPDLEAALAAHYSCPTRVVPGLNS